MAINHSTCEQLANKNYSDSEYQLMLSYSRAEASDAVRLLKQALESLEFNNIFLDVEGIVGGDEWASVLNNKVLNCDAFIALVTHNYGNTKWTRRELHLADQKDKLIVPINFLNSWPPDCLAIYLSPIHYIEWDPDVQKTAESIRDLLSKKMTAKRFPLIPPGVINSSLGPSDKSPIIHPGNWPIKGSEFKPKIVISAHPEQKEFTEFLRINLSENFQFKIWCTLDMLTDSRSSKRVNQRLAKTFKSEAKSKDTLFIFVLSQSYCSSKTCKQQAFYCDFRKKLVLIKYEEFEKPDWLSELFTEDEMGKPLPALEWLLYDPNDSDSFKIILNQRVMDLIEPVNDSIETTVQENTPQSVPIQF